MFVGPACVALVSFFFAPVERRALPSQFSIGLSFRQQRPENALILVGNRNASAVGASLFLESLDLGKARTRFGVRGANNSPGAVIQQGPQVLVPIFADAEQMATVSTGAVLGHEAEPGGQMTAILQLLSIPCGSY